MSKCAAVFELGRLKLCFEGDDPRGIIQNVQSVQDFGCLLSMGRAQEGLSGQMELDMLEDFLDKYEDDSLTMEDIKNLEVYLSAGIIRCLGIAETEDEIKALKAKKF